MKPILDELQEYENFEGDGYVLKNNDEIKMDIIEFGNGMCEFHTLDINRLLVENMRYKELTGIEKL